MKAFIGLVGALVLVGVVVGGLFFVSEQMEPPSRPIVIEIPNDTFPD